MSRLESLQRGVTFGFEALEGELRQEKGYLEHGYGTRALVHQPDLRVLLLAMREGARIEEHSADGTVTIQTLRGKLRLTLPEGAVELEAGQLLALARGHDHDVEALEESLFLLTIGWPGRGAEG